MNRPADETAAGPRRDNGESGGATAAAPETAKFLRYLALERCLARNTVESYGLDLEIYLRYLDSRGIDFKNVTRVELMDFLLAEKAEGKKASTLYRRLAGQVV